MAWLEIVINTRDADLEDTAAQLTAIGFSDLVLEDQEEFEDFLQENRACWDYIDERLAAQLRGLSRIRLYIEDTDQASLERLRSFTEGRSLPMEVKQLEETNWEESWKDNYPPVEVGKNLIVLPYWLAQGDDSGRTPIILDPGLSFGTGAHPSTQMVLEEMEQKARPGFHCLDLGSGSGILSIAALRLGAADAVGIDIDPKAEGIARENAAYNSFSSPVFTALTGNVTSDRALMDRLAQQSYDFVLVNIVADVIISLAPVLPKFLTENSTLICSGILNTRLEDVLDALHRAGLTVTGVREKEDWRCVTAKKER